MPRSGDLKKCVQTSLIPEKSGIFMALISKFWDKVSVKSKEDINELSHVQIPVMLMPDDFKAYSKIKVDNHLFNKENMPSHFKFKEYCPMVFRNLRERFGIDDQDFQQDSDFVLG
ncbi:UNVERIFIED_CONTAM: hypothetical protein K2H54_027053 [Gekko kuhli]